MPDDVFPDREHGPPRQVPRGSSRRTGGPPSRFLRSRVTSPDPATPTPSGSRTHFGQPETVIFGLTGAAARGLLGLLADQHGGGVELPIGALFIGLLVQLDLPAALLAVDAATYGSMFPDDVAFHGADGFRMLQFVVARPLPGSSRGTVTTTNGCAPPSH